MRCPPTGRLVCPLSQDQVAEAGFVGHDDTELRDGNRQDPPGRAGDGGQVGALPGEQADLAEKLVTAIPGDEGGAGLAVPLDFSAVPSSITIRS